MNKRKFFVVFVALILSWLFVWVGIRQMTPMLPEVKAIIDMHKELDINNTNNGWLASVGINNEDSDIFRRGQQYINQYHQCLQFRSLVKCETAAEILSMMQIDTICQPYVIRDCLANMGQQMDVAIHYMNTYRVLLNNRLALMDYSQYISNRYIFPANDLSVQRVLLNSIMLKFKQKHYQAAFLLLLKEVEYDRKRLVVANTLFDKVISLAMLNRSVLLYDAMYDTCRECEIPDIASNELLRNYSEQELSLKSAMEGELLFIHFLQRKAKREVEAWDDRLINKLVSAVMTDSYVLNFIYKTYTQPMIRLSQLPPGDYMAAKKQLADESELTLSDYLLNPIKSYLLGNSLFSFFTYSDELRALQASQILLRLKYTIVEQQLSNNQVTAFVRQKMYQQLNPFDASPVYWDADASELYFIIPNIDQANDKNQKRQAVSIVLNK